MGAGQSSGLAARLADRRRPLRLYSITPPRESTSAEDLERIGQVTIERLRPLDLDALILYDIEDEGDRNHDDRPFPYLATVEIGRASCRGKSVDLGGRGISRKETSTT